LGDELVKKHLKEGVTRKRVGFIVEGPPAREGVEIFSKEGRKVGAITSGTHSPCLKKSIGIAYVATP
jgi:aminomethyltransferase